jgi:hypothetical protein
MICFCEKGILVGSSMCSFKCVNESWHGEYIPVNVDVRLIEHVLSLQTAIVYLK